MKILQVNNNHFVRGGADRVYLNTGHLLENHGSEVAYFSSIDQRNIDSSFNGYFIARRDFRSAGFIEGLRGVREYLNNREAANNIRKLVSDFSPDIAHLHLFYGALSSSVLETLYICRVPMVITVHDYRLLCPANALLDAENRICERCKNKFYLNCLFGRCSDRNLSYSLVLTLEAYRRKFFVDPVKYIDKFIFVSRFAQQKHIEFDSRFADKSVQLYNFSDLSESDKSATKGRYILFFGRLSVEKGIVTLMKALKDTDIELVIAGNGPLEELVKKSVSESENISYVGYADGKYLNELIAGSSYVIVPSEWYENNPMTIVEANALGKPVIASRIGGIPEIVKEGVTGYLFAPGDTESMISTIKSSISVSDEMYSSLSDNARINAINNFSPDKHYNRLISIYEETIATK